MIKIRNKSNYKGDGVYMGRPTVFGNSWSHLNGTLAKFKVSTREESIEKFKEWFESQNSDSPIKKQLDNLIKIYKDIILEGELNLICWCHPKPCHLEIIKKYIYDRMENLKYE